jgi:tetratricopeptide (TPR) repeat protein
VAKNGSHLKGITMSLLPYNILPAGIFLILFSVSLSASLSSFSVFAATQKSLPLDANSIVLKAKALNARGKYKDAFTLLKAAPKNPASYAAIISNLANIDMDDAEEAANEAVSAFPKSAKLHYLRGVIMGNQAQRSIFSALGYAEKSLNSFVKATELEPTMVKYRKALMSFYLAAPSIAGGDEELALVQLKAIQKADALEGVSSQVAFYQMTNKPEKATQALQKAITDFPYEINFVFRLATYYAQQEDYKQALPLFQQAAEMPKPEFAIDPITGETQSSYIRNMSSKLNALYQVGRTAVVTNENTEEGLAAMDKLQAAVESSKLDTNNLPNMEWAKARIVELYIQSGDKKAASDLLMSVLVTDNKDLKKQVNKLKKQL